MLGVFAQEGFYYAGPAGQSVRNLWFAIDGVFLTMYGAGAMLFLYLLMKHTRYSSVRVRSSLASANG